MSNKTILLLTFLLAFSPALLAQDVYYGRAQQFSASAGDFNVVGRTGDRIYAYRVTNDAYFLDAYDDSMDLKATVALDFFPKKVAEVQFHNYNDHLLVLYQVLERGSMYMMGAVLNDRGMIQGKPKLLDSARTAWLSSKDNYFETKISEDANRIAVLGLGGSSRNISFKMCVFDNKLELINQRKVDLSKEKDAPTVSISKTVLTNTGIALIPNFDQAGRKRYLTDIRILTVDAASSEVLTQEWKTGDHYFSDFVLKLDNATQKCYIGGFYAMKKGDDVEGVCFGQFPFGSTDTPSMFYGKFTEDMETAVANNNTSHPFNNYTVNELVLKGNDGFVMLTEYATTEIRTSYNGAYVGYYSTYYSAPLNSSIREYEYGNVAAFSYAPSKGLEWMTIVPKNQYSQEDNGRFSSYGLINSGGQIVLMFNDYDRSRSNLQIAVINGAGKLTTTRLNQLNNRSDWVLRRAMQIDLKEIIIPALRQNDISFIKVNF